MKVKTLIEKLQKMNPEMTVVINSQVAKYGMDVDSVQEITMFLEGTEPKKYCEIKIDDRDFELDEEALEKLKEKKMED